jgi:hypothetical protein
VGGLTAYQQQLAAALRSKANYDVNMLAVMEPAPVRGLESNSSQPQVAMIRGKAVISLWKPVLSRLASRVAAKRCEDSYLLRLLEGTEYSDTIIRHLYHAPSRIAQGKLETLRRWWNQLRMPTSTREAWRAQRRGQQRANSEIAAGQWNIIA